MSRVVHFEIHVDDPERAITFYTKIFNWQFTKWDGPMPYWLIRTGPKEEPGIDGGLLKRHGLPAPENCAVIAYVCTVNVASVDEHLEKIVANGGLVAVPKMAVPGVGWLAYGKDTEGNVFGIMQSDPKAA